MYAHSHIHVACTSNSTTVINVLCGDIHVCVCVGGGGGGELTSTRGEGGAPKLTKVDMGEGGGGVKNPPK